ncbi:hypothetical protein [Clavibacter tessellarius]|uniref:hypothetical protein n=1 Tax=Clavibacter tessellarius TaxID=31965 RepID=UPI0039BEED07
MTQSISSDLFRQRLDTVLAQSNSATSRMQEQFTSSDASDQTEPRAAAHAGVRRASAAAPSTSPTSRSGGRRARRRGTSCRTRPRRTTSTAS